MKTYIFNFHSGYVGLEAVVAIKASSLWAAEQFAHRVIDDSMIFPPECTPFIGDVKIP